VAGRISETDRERVREANRIEQVVGEYVALKSAGGGNLKGLCPFHDEKTPSFQVSPARGYYHCFGCEQGGDVFAFIQGVEHLNFNEAVQRLADRSGIRLTMIEGGSSTRTERNTKPRLIAANKAAATFYAEQLATDGAATAREFLAERGFDLAAAAHFGCGYAPDGWDQLVKALTAQGFSLEELIRAGLARQGQRGPIDQFHRRLLWAIHDAAGDVVGFGARRLYDDDRLEAKYINTAETPLYKKSQVLFGLDLAKRDISRQRRAVVVEGYTDVMAMHLAGVTTAVASCGTAFGDEHISVLRRYLLDSEVIRGEVVYTFDGDTAGQKAALKAFDSDQRFAANTYVAVAPAGMDPCELRQAKGDEAVRALVDGRRPLFAFAITSTLDNYNLDTAEGQVAATAAAVPLVARIKEPTLRDEYARQLAGWLGTELGPIRAKMRAYLDAARRDGGQGARRGSPAPTRPGASASREGVRDGNRAGTITAPVDEEPPPPDDEPPPDGAHENGPPAVREQPAPDFRRPNPKNQGLKAEREALKLALQQPDLVAAAYQQVQAESFTEPAYAQIHRAIDAAGGPSMDRTGPVWVDAVRDQLPAGPLRTLVGELAVDRPEWPSDVVEARYAGAILARLAERVALIEERNLHSALQRAEAAGDPEPVRELLAQLIEVANYRRALSDRAKDQV